MSRPVGEADRPMRRNRPVPFSYKKKVHHPSAEDLQKGGRAI
jgi:hypothetical protein